MKGDIYYLKNVHGVKEDYILCTRSAIDSYFYKVCAQVDLNSLIAVLFCSHSAASSTYSEKPA